MKTLARLLIVSASLLGAYLIILACAGGDWDEEVAKISFFSQKMLIDKPADTTFTPLFRRITQPFYGNQLGDYNNIRLFTDKNLEEWTAHFQGELPASEIRWILYQSTLEEIDHMILYSKDNNYGKMPGKLKGKVLFRLKDQAKAREFLYYTGFARRCEKVAAAETNEWGYYDDQGASNEDGKYLADLLQAAGKMMETPKSDFVKERYRFQIIRLLYQQANQYAGSYQECIRYFENCQSDFKVSNQMRYRALGYVAAAYRKLEKFAEANLLYARIYDNCPEMRTVAQFSFRPMEEADFRQSLSLAKNAREKAALWHLLGIYGDELRAMKEIYAIDPASDLLNLLLVRNVSKLEEKMLPENDFWYDYLRWDNGVNPDNEGHRYQMNPQGIERENFDFIKKATDANNTDKPFLWNFSTGYLCLVKGDFPTSRAYFSKARSQAGQDQLKLDQLRIMDILTRITEPKTITPAVETALAADYQWLNENEGLEYEEQMKKEEAKTFLFKTFSQKYLRQGDTLKAVLCVPYCVEGFYYDDAKLAAMAAWLLREDKSPFERALQDHYPFKPKDIYEVQAIRLAYRGDIDGAIAKFDQYGAGETVLLGNPFNIHINDCHDCDHEAKQWRKFTKLDFMREVKLMEGIVAQKPSTSDYFLLANAYYNMTYFGNARVFYSSAISDYDTHGLFYFPFSENADWQTANGYNRFIFDCSKAEKYYLLAANSTDDREMKAKCLFMAAKCEQNDFFCFKDAGDRRDFKAGKYFKMLKSDYRDTKYYKEILKECGYFRKFNT